MTDRACRDCGELISAHIDGVATREENERLRQHLATCADCRATLDAYRQIGGAIKALPAIHAPQQLTAAIYAQTIDAEPRRLFLITSRLGYSLAAVASVLLIFVVAAYLIIGGYQRGIDPVVDTFEPKTNQVWELQRPIEITFNKEMNRESVIAALGMQPSGEKDRLALTWDGNTLIIGGNTTLLKPGASYEIKISTDATDTYGNALKDPFQLAFTTQTTLATIQTPTPGPSPTATIEHANPTQSPAMTPSTGTDLPGSDNQTPVAPTATSGGVPSPGTGGGTQVVPVNPDPPFDPTATSSPTPTPTEEPVEATGIVESTSTPTPTPTSTATMTPVPPTATPTSTATATATTPIEPTATVTPDSIPVTGAIGDVYWSDQTVQDRLGEPMTSELSFGTEQLDFQHGVMLLDETNLSIYVLRFGAGWDTFNVPTGDHPTSDFGPDAEIYIPGGAFGALWAQEQSISDSLGYALTRYPIGDTASVQYFTDGLMLATPSTVYVIYSDHTWDWFTRSDGS